MNRTRIRQNYTDCVRESEVSESSLEHIGLTNGSISFMSHAISRRSNGIEMASYFMRI